MKTSHVFLLLIFISTVLAVNFYADLGVDRRASNRDIRRAFRQLALKYHPDRNPDDPDAEKNFLKIARAYEVLSDPEARRRYDLPGGSAEFEEKTVQSTPQYQHFQQQQHNYGFAANHMKTHEQRHQDALRRAQQMHDDATRRAHQFHEQHTQSFGNIHNVHTNTLNQGRNCKTTVITSGNTVTTHFVCT